MNIRTVLASKGPKIVTIRAEQTIREALLLLGEHNIGALVVVGAPPKPAGIVSERDIVRALTQNEVLFDWPVSRIMTADVVVGSPEDDLDSVMHTMTEKRIRHLPVLEGGKLVGIVSIGDIVKAQRDRLLGEVETLETQIIEGHA